MAAASVAGVPAGHDDHLPAIVVVVASPRELEAAGRVRAACAYADLMQAEVAEALGYSRRSWARVEAGEEMLGATDLRRLAELCEVPVEFFKRGFGPGKVANEEIGEVVELIYRTILDAVNTPDLTLASLVERLHRIERALVALVGSTPEALERAARDYERQPTLKGGSHQTSLGRGWSRGGFAPAPEPVTRVMHNDP